MKWSGLYPLAAFLVLITVIDVVHRFAERHAAPAAGVRTPGRRVLASSLWQALVVAAITLPTACAAYLASWIGWIVNPGGQNREPGVPWWVSLWRWHVDSYAWHSTLSAPHPYQANPLGWPLALRPTAMYDRRWDSYVQAITPLPNPLVTWGGVAAMLLLSWIVARALVRAARRRSLAPLAGRTGVAVSACALVLTGYLSGWLPWVLTPSRSAVFQFYTVVLTPFSALALAIALTAVAGLGWPRARMGEDAVARLTGLRLDPSPLALQGRRIAVALLCAAALVLALLFWPLWIGMPVEYWFYRAHLWLPGWS